MSVHAQCIAQDCGRMSLRQKYSGHSHRIVPGSGDLNINVDSAAFLNGLSDMQNSYVTKFLGPYLKNRINEKIFQCSR